METSNLLTPEERARITEIQDLLIERYVRQKEELERNNRVRAREIEDEIEALKREMVDIKEWANV